MPLTFTRNRFFWVVALQTAIVNFYLGGFGPAQPLLRADQGTSLAIAGLHGTAMGVAAIFAGFANPWIAHRFGRDKSTWIGLTFFSVGLVAFVFSPPVQLTLLATFIAGFGTSIVINSVLTSMSHHYGKSAAGAISQANGVAFVGFSFGTFLIGSIATLFPSQWRLGLLLAIPAAIALALFGREKESEEHIPDKDGRQSGKLSLSFWIALCGFTASISSAFAISFWAAALLRDRVGSTAAIATLSIVAYGVGMAIGCWYGGMVLKRFKLDHQLMGIIALQLIGFIIFWFSHLLLLSILALFIIGLGSSIQLALSSIRLIGLSDGRPDLAIGLSSQAVGLAIAGAPLILGLLGDHIGISRAYLMVPALIAFAFTVVVAIPSRT